MRRLLSPLEVTINENRHAGKLRLIFFKGSIFPASQRRHKEIPDNFIPRRKQRNKISGMTIEPYLYPSKLFDQ